MTDQSQHGPRRELFRADGGSDPETRLARDARPRRVLVSAALLLVGATVIVIVADEARRHGAVSELVGDVVQYGTAFLLGLLLIRLVVTTAGGRIAGRTLIAAMFCLFVSGFLNVTNDIQGLVGWPLLGAGDPLNALVKDACELTSILLVLFALVVAVLSSSKARDDLVEQHERLLGEVAERERAEDEVNAHVSFLNTVMEQSPFAMWISDHTGLVFRTNKALREALGLKDEQVSLKYNVLHDDNLDEQGVRTQVRAVFEELRPARFSTLWLSSKAGDAALGGGRDLWVDVSMFPILDSAGNLRNVVCQWVDITDRKLADEERARLEEQYRQSQKMEAIGQLTGGVAHDFNNLLQVINVGTEMAMQDLETGHPAHESLEEVAKAGERAARLVSQLLLFSRRQIMRPESLDLNTTVANLLKMLVRVIGEHIQLQWHPGSRVGTIRADRGMIEQALMNLCVNARDAMPDGGTLTIQTDGAMIDDAFCTAHAWARPGNYALLTVTDTGCGIEQENLERIFEPFFTTKETGKGTGLGLATVYGIVRQHDGIVRARSEPGRGASFDLYWPLHDAKAETSGSAAKGEPRGGSETVLLVEDDGRVRRLARVLLEKAGYTVLMAADGAEAVAVFEERCEDVDMAILDVVMPKMGGRDAYERMLEVRPDLRALFASGYSDDAIHTGFVLEDGLSFIQKPFTRDALLHAVRDVLDRPDD